ncbi:MAG: DNA polymerase III subunit delta [Phycisphaerales bacterium]
MARAASTSRQSGAGAPDATMRIVVLTGKDSFLRVERSRQLQEALEAHFGAVDRFDIDGAGAPLSAVLDELRSYGLLAQHKLVIVDNAEVFLGAEDRRRAMERYAENPQPESTLLLRAGARWNPGKFDKLVEACGGAVLKCDAPSDAEAARWCGARATKQHGTALEPGAAELLVEKIGPDLARLDSELGKLAAAAGQGRPIARALVAEFVGLSREEQAWEIQSVLLRDGPKATLAKLDELVRVSGVPEVMIGWSIVDILRKVHDAARLLAQGQNEFAVAKQLRLWGDAQAVVVRAAKRLGPHRAAQLLAEAVRADARTKSGLSSDSVRTFEALVVTIGEGVA